MAISLASLRKASSQSPPRILVHGVAGVGKTSLAMAAPAPVIIQTEDGLGTIEGDTFGVLKTYDEVIEALGSLYTEDHQFKTVVVDSIDWMEPLVWNRACRDNGWKSIEDSGYGKGYIAALDLWRQYLDGLNALRDERGMTIVQIAHTDVKKFDSPEHEPYDRYVIKLHTKAAALVMEHCDVILFENYRISTQKTEKGFKKTHVRGVGGGSRVIYTVERPAFLAKNRYAMPDSIDLPDVRGNDPALWQAVASHIPMLADTLTKET